MSFKMNVMHYVKLCDAICVNQTKKGAYELT
jgi:hypothetical protein